MTETELSQYRFLVKEAERLHKTMDETLEQEYINYKSPVIDGMPHGNTTSDATFNAAVNASKKKDTRADRSQFMFMLATIEHRIYMIETFIYKIPDDRTRLIFQYKYFDGMTDEAIGNELNYSRSNINKIIWDYLKSSKNSRNVKNVCYNITME